MVFKNFIKLLTGTFVSRIFGLIREIIVASFFGTSLIADAFTFALRFPNLFRQILGEDMVERAFMPPFKTIYDQGNTQGSWRYLSVIFNWFVLSLLIVMGVLYVLIPLLFMAGEHYPGYLGFLFSSENFDYHLSLRLILILLPFMFFIGIAAFVGSLLNFFEKNLTFSFAPVMLSIGVIISVVTLAPYINGFSIAIGYVLGAFLQFFFQVPVFLSGRFRKESHFQYHPILKTSEFEFKTIKRESGIISLNALFNKSSEIFTAFLAATLVQGAVSSIFFAQRLYQLPFGIVSLSISRAVNPGLNRLKSLKRTDSFNHLYNRGIMMNIFLSLPITIIFIIASKEIVNIVYGRGEFGINSILLTSDALIGYSAGLLPMSLVAFYTRVLSLFSKNKYALVVSVLSAVINIGFSIVLARFTQLGHAGIAVANSIAFSINMLVLRKYVKKEIGDYLAAGALMVKSWVVPLMVSFVLVWFSFENSLYWIDTKMVSFYSLGGKTFLVFLVWAPFAWRGYRSKG